MLPNARAERYHSRNLATERDVIGQYDLIVERAHIFLCDSRDLIVLFLKKKSPSDMICHDWYIIFAAGKYN